jgi:hypothetical protein
MPASQPPVRRTYAKLFGLIVEMTQMYIHADLRLKEKSRITTPAARPGRCRPDDKLLASLEAL